MVEATRTLLAANFGESLQYRGSAVMWTFTSFLTQLMALSLWATVARENGGVVGGYSQGDLVTYFVCSQLVILITGSWAAWKMMMGIRNGTLSAELLRPIPPFIGWWTEIYGFKLVMAAIQVPALLLVSVLLGATVPDAGWTILLAPVAIALTMAMRFAIEICLGSSCFWLTDLRGVAGTWFLAFLLLSGSFAPIALMPPTLRTIAELSPFYYLLGFPVDLATGRVDGADAAFGFAMQLGWGVVAVLLARFLWERGLRRYSAVGA